MTQGELNAALVLSRKLERLRGRLADLEATGGVKAAGSSTPVQGGTKVSQAQIAAELSQEISELTRQLEIEQAIIQRALDKIPFDELERKLMLLRYVECRPWRAVACALGYTDRRAYQIHITAKQKISVDFT